MKRAVLSIVTALIALASPIAAPAGPRETRELSPKAKLFLAEVLQPEPAEAAKTFDAPSGEGYVPEHAVLFVQLPALARAKGLDLLGITSPERM